MQVGVELNQVKEDLNQRDLLAKGLENELKEKDKKLKTSVLENKTLHKEIRDLEAKLETVTQVKAIEALDRNIDKLKCSICNDSYESVVSLSEHKRKYHFKDQVSQTRTINCEASTQIDVNNEPFLEEYPCFYCAEIISRSPLDHYEVCDQLGLPLHENGETETYVEQIVSPFPNPTSFPPPTLFPPAFGFPIIIDEPCYTCGERLRDKIQLRRHYNCAHPEIILFWCDMCLTNFGSERGLKSHMRNAHRQ